MISDIHFEAAENCVLLCYYAANNCNFLPTFLDYLLVSNCTDYHIPLHLTTCNNPYGWYDTVETFHRPHTLPSTNSILRLHASFLDSWTLRMGPKGCPETSVRNYHHSLRNNPEKLSSRLSFNLITNNVLILTNLWKLHCSMAPNLRDTTESSVGI